MAAKRLFIPDNVMSATKAGTDKTVRLLQYTSLTTTENFDVFLTHNALVYILSGIKQIKIAQSGFQINPGELFLIPRGEYVMSEYLTGENGFRSVMLFFTKKAAQDILERIDSSLLTTEHTQSNNAVKIISPNQNIERLFLSLEAYSKGDNPYMCELVRLKFSELIYLLLDSPYRQLIITFLVDASKSENPSIASVLDNHLYSSATIKELAMFSGRSLSSYKREFTSHYGEPPRSWIRKKKLERAAFLLETTDKTMEEISEACGFVSTPHFSRLFKEQYQLTPTAFRAKQAKT
ncbi:AraC family transcriptional regulator [Bacteroides sp.]|uniref:helix-turn-helix domain-containing protein n=1 Tax=Bacteroides sp. TaxID=29523 RepID=UPI00263075ED|nr:AraC family transcriptional regulator [Bacteroides sp.]